mmetsp:Transcript_3271/g.8441  ORF Transcript_3271/g.8441 Transcript_3271/m.8441 type:complete len:277 (+) Transcript_3271:490-1320(+)
MLLGNVAKHVDDAAHAATAHLRSRDEARTCELERVQQQRGGETSRGTCGDCLSGCDVLVATHAHQQTLVHFVGEEVDSLGGCEAHHRGDISAPKSFHTLVTDDVLHESHRSFAAVKRDGFCRDGNAASTSASDGSATCMCSQMRRHLSRGKSDAYGFERRRDCSAERPRGCSCDEVTDRVALAGNFLLLCRYRRFSLLLCTPPPVLGCDSSLECRVDVSRVARWAREARSCVYARSRGWVCPVLPLARVQRHVADKVSKLFVSDGVVGPPANSREH